MNFLLLESGENDEKFLRVSSRPNGGSVASASSSSRHPVAAGLGLSLSLGSSPVGEFSLQPPSPLFVNTHLQALSSSSSSSSSASTAFSSAGTGRGNKAEVPFEDILLKNK